MSESGKTILCIDNDGDTCDLIKFVFREKGFEVIACQTAEEGVFQLRRNRFAAVILDNHFKSSSGVDTCQEIRRFDAKIPIVFFSGESRPKEIEKALLAGANAYLVKPIGFEELPETVIKFIEENSSVNQQQKQHRFYSGAINLF